MPWKVESTHPCILCGQPCSRRATRCSGCKRNGQAPDPAKAKLCKDCGGRASTWGHRCRRCAYIARKNRTRAARPCQQCQHLIQPPPSLLARGSGKFCSRACYAAWQHERERAEETVCTRCGVRIRRKSVYLRRSRRVFCSLRCASLFNRGPQHPFWRGGSDPNRGRRWHRMAALIRQRDGDACVRCGRSEAENGARLSVDHIVPWRYLPKRLANHPANLVTVCKSCHAWKTNVAERRWLHGDVQAFAQYRRSVRDVPCVHSLPGRWKMLRVDLAAVGLAKRLRELRRGPLVQAVPLAALEEKT